jgi:hypothetical protein
MTRALTANLEDEAQLIRTDPTTLAALNRTEVDAQLDAAHRYPRVMSKFVREAMSVAITNQEVAKSCMYTLKRRGEDGKPKNIVGPSIRLAEICAATYGNLHAGARPVEVDETTVTCQGVCWDVERNVRVITEVKRRITTKSGRRYGEDMIIVTQNACSAIAFRNAIFRVIPRALIDRIFARVREVATGAGKTMEQKQKEMMDALARLGVPADRVLAEMGRVRVEDLTIEDIEVLIGLGTRIKDGGETADEVFPGAAATGPLPGQEGQRAPLKRPAKPPAAAAETVKAKPEAPPAPAAEPEDRGDDPALDHQRTRKTAPMNQDEVPPWEK